MSTSDDTRSVDTRSLQSLALLMGAIQDQRDHLLNVLGTVQCVKAKADQADDEATAGALELLEQEVQRVVTGLEEPELLKAAAARGRP